MQDFLRVYEKLDTQNLSKICQRFNLNMMIVTGESECILEHWDPTSNLYGVIVHGAVMQGIHEHWYTYNAIQVDSIDIYKS